MSDLGDDFRKINDARKAGKCPAGCKDWRDCQSLKECQDTGERCPVSRWKIPKDTDAVGTT